MSLRSLFYIGFILCFTCDAANILVLPGNVNSHALYFAKLSDGLAKLGHKVHVVAPANGKVPRNLSSRNLTISVYGSEGEAPYANSEEASESLMKYALSDSKLEKFQMLYAIGNKMLASWESDCIHLLEDEKLMDEIRKGGFQFAIMDPISISCYYSIPYSLGIPFASLAISFSGWQFRNPRLPSFVSAIGESDEMTFTQRLTSFVSDYVQLKFINETTVFVEKLAPHRPPLRMLELYEMSSLFFYLEDLSVGYPRPQMPNSVAVGDIMAQPAKALPKDLQEFLDDSPEGALIVSFGSFFDHIPEFVAKKFCDAFQRIKYRVIWKIKSNEFCSGLSNVRTMPWIPQNDLLAHKNVRLFITHGGLNGLIESVYHSKPVIVFPIALDQPGNAVAAEYKGFGINMKLSSFTAQDLEDNIRRIFTEKSFVERAEFASAILRHKQETPPERVSFLIEHVLKYGDLHLQSGALKLSTFQFIMFDIYLFLTCLALTIGVVLVLCVVCSYRICKRCVFRQPKEKTA